MSLPADLLAKSTLTTHIVATPQLRYETDQGWQELKLLQHKSWIIGRHKNCQILIRDSGVSRQHARIDVLKAHHCLFSDLNSRNGCRINGQPVTEPLLLKHGDRIKIGRQELLFLHSMLTTPGAPIPAPIKQVFMLQTSVIQGKIWEEVLLSQDISTVWGAPGADLQTLVMANAAAQTLPKLLLVDLAPYRATYLDFCQWCASHHPQVRVVFIDRKPTQRPNENALQVLPSGMHYCSAFPERDLTQSIPLFMEQTNHFLQLLDSRRVRRSALIAALTALEELFQEVPAFATLLPDHAQPDALDDELTDFFPPSQRS